MSINTFIYKRYKNCQLFRFFPKIFGQSENLPLDKQGTLEAFQKLTKEVKHEIVAFNLIGTVFAACQECLSH